MIFPKAMSEIELIVPAGDLMEVTKILAGRGTFHQVEAGLAGAEKRPASDIDWTASAASYAGLERRVQALVQSLGIQEAVNPPAAVSDPLEVEAARAQIDAIEREVRSVTDRLAATSKSLEKYLMKSSSIP